MRRATGGQDSTTRNGVAGCFRTFFKNRVAHFDALVANIGAGFTARRARYEIGNFGLVLATEGASQPRLIRRVLWGHQRLDSIKVSKKMARWFDAMHHRAVLREEKTENR